MFGMNKIFRQNIDIGWHLLKFQCRQQATANNEKNKTQIQHSYKIWNLVLIIQKKYGSTRKAKLASLTEGPDEIIHVYTNGNMQI